MISMVTDPTGDAPHQLSWFLGCPHSEDTAQLPNPLIAREEVPHVLKLLRQMWTAVMSFAKESERLRWNLISMPRDIYTDLTQELPSPTAIQELLSIRYVTHPRRTDPTWIHANDTTPCDHASHASAPSSRPTATQHGPQAESPCLRPKDTVKTRTTALLI